MAETKAGSSKSSYTNKEKLEIIKHYAGNRDYMTITQGAAQSQVSRSTMKKFWRIKIDDRKRRRYDKHKELEQEKFLLLARSLRLLVAIAVIQAKAESLREKY